MFYPKIDTLFDRDSKFKVDTTKFRRPEFAYVNRWLWMEKLDGANISIVATNTGTHWRGRTARSEFISDITNHLDLRCEAWVNLLDRVLVDHKLDSFEIFGEVYGPKIQNGGIYRDDINTKFYDIRVNGHTWLDHETVRKYSDKLEFDIPTFSYGDTDWLVDQVRQGFYTYERPKINPNDPFAEGIVAKTPIPLYTNKGDRLIWKLKHKDFA